MKYFILGVAITLIVGIWIALILVGAISVKAAILVPVGIFIGIIIAVLLFGFLWRS